MKKPEKGDKQIKIFGGKKIEFKVVDIEEKEDGSLIVHEIGEEIN